MIWILILLPTIKTAAIEHTYTSHSVLSSGKWIKIRVQESGIYKITYEQLAKAGLQPENVRIYGYGGAMLSQDFNRRKIDDLPPTGFYMHKGTDNIFNAGDYILFYGQGPISWGWTGTRFGRIRNPYSMYGYYFLSDNAGEQKILFASTATTQAGDTIIRQYTACQLHEKETLNLVDANNGREGGGRDFYGETIEANKKGLSITFPLNDIAPNSSITAFAKMAAHSNSVSTFVVTVNGKSAYANPEAISSGDSFTRATVDSISITADANTNATKQDITITYNGDNSAKGYLDYVEINTLCEMRMSDAQIWIRSTANYGKNITNEYRLAGADINTQIWDITDLDSITAVATYLENDTLRWTGKNNNGLRTYIAVNTTANTFVSPDIAGAIGNQDLHALKDIDMVIITPEKLLGAANDLADIHREADAMDVAVVLEQEIFNEYSSGTDDATAYRWLMKQLYDRGAKSGRKPSYLVLMGTGTFDNRKILKTSGNRVLLTYQAKNSTSETKGYATDDYFAFLDNSEGETDAKGRMDIAVGRFPVTDASEANIMIDKIRNYIALTSPGDWQSKLLFVADDGDNNTHTQTADIAAERVRRKNEAFIVTKLYMDANEQVSTASGESYPLAKNKYDNMLANGVLFMDYSGHGSITEIMGEHLMNKKEVQNMSNKHLAFWMLATCNFSHFDAGERCIAEYALLNPNGGAIGVLSADRTVYASNNTVFNKNFCDTLFGHSNEFTYDMTIGQATRIAKNMTGNEENKMAYVLLGDPALRLNYPTQRKAVITQRSDTMRALAIDTLKGEILMSDGKKDTLFNGKVQISVLDKMQKITTRDNDQQDEGQKTRYPYNDYPSTLFKGETEVEKGTFELTFRMPKDIRYNFGAGRIVISAQDTAQKIQAIGYHTEFTIGGSSNIKIEDNQGPDVDIYLNNPFFSNGGQTHETPYFYADIYDKNGINTSGTGIGHDLTLVIDNDQKQTYAMNDYYTAKTSSYQEGQVCYMLSELKEGRHELTFRAWDLLNNSTTKTLAFEVVKGLTPTLYSVVVGPNPAKRSEIIRWHLQYDREQQICPTELYIYNLSGQQVWHATETDAKSIEWNTGNMNIEPGIYIYQLRVSANGTDYAKHNGKILIK